MAELTDSNSVENVASSLTLLSTSPSSPGDSASALTDSQRIEEVTMQTLELVDNMQQNLVDVRREGTSSSIDAVRLKNRDLIWRHISSCYTNSQCFENVQTSPGSESFQLQPKNQINIAFDSGCEWITSSTDENQLKSNLEQDATCNIIMLEFFTHCCINCIHSIEDVRQVYKIIQTRTQHKLEEQENSSGKNHGCGLKIVSVHSPKFTREKDVDSVRAFVKRNNMTHTDVVNDPNCALWTALNINCWPTILIFGPNPNQNGLPLKLNLLYTLVGEGSGHKETLQLLLENTIDFFNSKMKFSSILHNLPNPGMKSDNKSESTKDQNRSLSLSFPGKVLLHNNLLVISDSGNNRLILCSTDGHVKEIIGGTESGYANGDFQIARFYNPQGVAFHYSDENIFYVADTGNHSVREINLSTRLVSTLVEPNARTTGDNEAIIHLKSPWDLAFYEDNLLLIVGAGNHQIFCYCFMPKQLFTTAHLSNSFDLVAGTGKEENRNNSYIRKASFCQPSGICVSQVLNENDKVIYIADSESSTIRFINSAGRVQPLVGGTKDPTDLFAYGDADGCGYDVRLQHPVSVCSATGATKIFIADTYNHKIKMIDCESKHCATIIGDGTAGNLCGGFTGYPVPKKRSSQGGLQASSQHQLALLNEPNGLAIDQNQNFLYIADTNNHNIKIANLKNRSVSELELMFDVTDSSSNSKLPSVKMKTEAEKYDQDFYINLSSELKTFDVELSIHGLPENIEGGEWKIFNTTQTSTFQTGILVSAEGKGTILLKNLNFPDNSNIIVQVNIFLCGSTSCFRKTLNFHLIATMTSSTIGEDNEKIQPVLLNYFPTSQFFNEI